MQRVGEPVMPFVATATALAFDVLGAACARAVSVNDERTGTGDGTDLMARSTADMSRSRAALDLADRDRGGVAARFVGCRVEISKLPIGDTLWVYAQRGGVIRVETLDERLRRQRASTSRACINPCSFVDFIAQRGDLGPSARRNAADVQR